MLLLINTNRMQPLIAPLGLEYVAGAARQAGIDTELLDLALADDPEAALTGRLRSAAPRLIGLTFRNVDDCFWPSAQSFVPELVRTVERIRALTDAPIVLGGVGYSVFARELVERTGADFGIRGDGEHAMVELYREVCGGKRFERVGGLIWRRDGCLAANPPAWAEPIQAPTARDTLDNAAYFRLGGQAGLETKRGCHRPCIYCADSLAKGSAARLRPPTDVADEVESLLRQGVDVLHTCDAEFNIPRAHAQAVCEEFIRRGLGERLRWYAYLAVVPFDAALAELMAGAGCVGINFTADSASPAMLATYRQPHRREDLAAAARLCRERGIAVMFDLLLGGPGEMPTTLRDTIQFFKSIAPDCVGASLGVRLYPGTPMTALVESLPPDQLARCLRRRYDGPLDLLQPTFYISDALGERPAELVRELIAGDTRFFPPMPEKGPGVVVPKAPCGPLCGNDSRPFFQQQAPDDHNYNDNSALVAAIAAGARGAYWDILRRMPRSAPV